MAQPTHSNKPRLRDRTDRAWFSRLLQHPARKRSESILTTPEPARGARLHTINVRLIVIKAYRVAPITPFHAGLTQARTPVRFQFPRRTGP